MTGSKRRHYRNSKAVVLGPLFSLLVLRADRHGGRSPFAFRGARLRVDAETPDLNLLKGHTMSGGTSGLIPEKDPDPYVEKFQKFEKSMTETVMPRSELLAWAGNSGENSDEG